MTKLKSIILFFLDLKAVQSTSTEGIKKEEDNSKPMNNTQKEAEIKPSWERSRGNPWFNKNDPLNDNAFTDIITAIKDLKEKNKVK